MKRKLHQTSVVVAAIVLFVGIMFLNIEKNQLGQWKMVIASSFGQGGEDGSIVQIYHYNLTTINQGVPNFASGRTHLFPNPGSLAGIATVYTPSYKFRGYLYTKTGDNSNVGYNGTKYQIGYSATYTTSVVGLSSISVFDSFLESI